MSAQVHNETWETCRQSCSTVWMGSGQELEAEAWESNHLLLSNRVLTLHSMLSLKSVQHVDPRNSVCELDKSELRADMKVRLTNPLSTSKHKEQSRSRWWMWAFLQKGPVYDNISLRKHWILIKYRQCLSNPCIFGDFILFVLVVVVYFNLSTLKAQNGRSMQVQGQPSLHNEFQDS